MIKWHATLAVAASGLVALTACGDVPRCVDGIYPHLAMFNDEGEWVRVKALEDITGATAHFRYGPKNPDVSGLLSTVQTRPPIEARLGLVFINGRPMALDALWKNGTAAKAYWLWERWLDLDRQRREKNR